MNTANSTDLKDYYLDKLFGIIDEIVAISAGGDYINRGEPRCYPKISSTLYRSYESAFDSGQFTIEQIQEIETQKVKDYIRNQDKPDFEIASELQHYGGESNLIDFTTDYHIALYFACAKLHGKDDHDEDGRIVLLQRNQETIEKYQIERAQYPPNRVEAQNSIFVQPPEGFILPNDKDVQTVCIPKELKQWILIHLHRFQDISYQTLFNDMYGFLGQESLRTSRNAWQGLEIERYFAENFPVENLTDEERQERHERTVKAHITRIEYSPYETTFYEELGRYFCFKMREYDCAIETFSQAILLKPDYSSGYIRRGVAYTLKGDLDRAISDFVKVTQLNPGHPHAYTMLGSIYDRQGDRPRAIEYYKKVLELDPNNSAARGYLSSSERGDITIPQLSENAYYLLNEAAADPQRKIEHFNLEQGIIVLINEKDIIQEDLRRRNIRQDRRETVEAEWGSALRELESVGYLERVDAPQPLTLFRVTEDGYKHSSHVNSSS